MRCGGCWPQPWPIHSTSASCSSPTCEACGLRLRHDVLQAYCLCHEASWSCSLGAEFARSPAYNSQQRLQAGLRLRPFPCLHPLAADACLCTISTMCGITSCLLVRHSLRGTDGLPDIIHDAFHLLLFAAGCFLSRGTDSALTQHRCIMVTRQPLHQCFLFLPLHMQ